MYLFRFASVFDRTVEKAPLRPVPITLALRGSGKAFLTGLTNLIKVGSRRNYSLFDTMSETPDL